MGGFEPCRWCGLIGHLGRCPDLRAMEFHQDGTIKRVEFFSSGERAPSHQQRVEERHRDQYPKAGTITWMGEK